MSERHRNIPDDFFEKEEKEIENKKNSINESDKKWQEIYRNKLREYKRLTGEEEEDLSRRIHEGDPNAKERFINSNLPLVIKIATKYARDKQIMDNLIQEGNLGLIKAVEKFDPSLGNKFSTYATPWIKQYITRYLDEKQTPIKLSGNYSQRQNVKFVSTDEPIVSSKISSTIGENLESNTVSPEAAASKNETAAAVREAVNSLPKERDRQIAEEH